MAEVVDLTVSDSEEVYMYSDDSEIVVTKEVFVSLDSDSDEDNARALPNPKWEEFQTALHSEYPHDGKQAHLKIQLATTQGHLHAESRVPAACPMLSMHVQYCVSLHGITLF